MSEFKKKEQYQFWHSPIALLLLFCVLVVFTYNIVGLIKKEMETNNKKSLVLDQIAELNKRQDSLTRDINKLNTDQGVEDMIREKYQVVKEGEKMVTIVNEEAKPAPVVEENNKHGFVEWVKNLFKK